MRGQAKPGIHLFDPGGGTCPASTNDHRLVIGPEAEDSQAGELCLVGAAPTGWGVWMGES